MVELGVRGLDILVSTNTTNVTIDLHSLILLVSTLADELPAIFTAAQWCIATETSTHGVTAKIRH